MRLMLDTHPRIEAMLIDRWRTMTAGQKLLQVADLIETGEVLSRSGVRHECSIDSRWSGRSVGAEAGVAGFVERALDQLDDVDDEIP